MQIPSDVLDQLANNGKKSKKNVLFVALSSFSISRGENKLRSCRLVHDNDDLGDYYYQLEPILKLFSHENRKIDEILVLCTKETITPKTIEYKGEEENSSELHFFTSRAKELFPDCVINPLPKELFADGSSINESVNELTSIKQVIKELRNLRKKYVSEQTEMSLTIDIHGGHRSTQMQVQSIISLLRYEDIIPKDIYTVNFSSDTGIGKIVEAKEAIDINKFVSGMNEFFSYGRTNTLDEYYAFEDNELVKIVRNISDAIQLCHIQKFDDAIKDLKKYVDRYQEKNDYADLFIDAIKSSYGKLLDREGRKEVINKIKWCVNNSFIQQALTIIESQMPQEFYNKRIISYSYDYDESFRMVRLYRSQNKEEMEIRGGILLSDALNNAKPEWEPSINFALVSWLRQNCCPRTSKNSDGNIEYLPIRINGDNILDYMTAEVRDNELSRFSKANTGHDGSYIKIMMNVNPYLNPEQKKNLARLFRLHMALKEQRNASNHAGNRDRSSVEEVKVAINAYIKLTEMIYDAINQEQQQD